MNNKIFLLILILFLIHIVNAENITCQYQEKVKTDKQVSVLNVFGENRTGFLETKNIKTFYDYPTPRYLSYFELHNNLEIPVDVEVRFLSNGNTIAREEIIEAKKYLIIGNYENLDISNITYIYKSNDYAVSDWIDEEITKCKLCLGKPCLNDGDSCSLSSQCGGGYCVEGRCNTDELCYNNNCACSSDKIQCTDNKRCVKKEDKDIGHETSCNLIEECKTIMYISCLNSSDVMAKKYFNQTTNTCEEHPLIAEKRASDNPVCERKEIENTIFKIAKYIIITVISLTILFIAWTFYKKHRSKKIIDIEKNIHRLENEKNKLEKHHADIKKSIQQLKEEENQNKLTISKQKIEIKEYLVAKKEMDEIQKEYDKLK